MTLRIAREKPYLRLEQVENGGWVIGEMPDDLRVSASIIGAFSNTHDMLDALRATLLPENGKQGAA